jgi:hypothetical protein
MIKNKTSHEVKKELKVVKREITTLQNKQISLNLLHQFHRQGVTRPYATGFVAGNTQLTRMRRNLNRHL